MRITIRSKCLLGLALACVAAGARPADGPSQKPVPKPAGPAAAAPAGKPAEEFPPFAKTIEGLARVPADGGLYDLYVDEEAGRLLAVLPPGYEKQMLMIACTVSGGHPEAGVMGPTHYAQWRRIGKQLALMEPPIRVRTDGDAQAADSMAQLFTDHVRVAVPILALAPGNRPTIDLGSLAVTQAVKLFADSASPSAAGPALEGLDPSLAQLVKAKAFPENVVVQYEAPGPSGNLVTVSYSIGKLEGTPGFEPRVADRRVGYFYDWSLDFAKPGRADDTKRLAWRWHLAKADPSLRMSPPVEPIVWYIEHTTPIRYRRYLREGIQWWNEAFEGIGISNAVEVYQQDSATGAHMEKDPEDARYNFFRWNVNDVAYAIGPSRTNPYTGEILDADIVWNSGLTRSILGMLGNFTAEVASEAFGPEARAWLRDHPAWDPALRFAAVLGDGMGGRPGASEWEERAVGGPAACGMGMHLTMEFGLAGAVFDSGLLPVDDDALLDGVPEEFLGAMIRYIAAHEVGHTLGLQHNMTASTLHSLEEINAPGFEGPTVASVMEYAAVNIAYPPGGEQGPYATPGLGPYDHWAIAWGYGPADGQEALLAQVAEREHLYVNPGGTVYARDPRNTEWDLGSDNLAFCESRLRLIADLRARLLSDVVRDGESWSLARRRFNDLVMQHVHALNLASEWVGGIHENSGVRGDEGCAPPVQDIPAAQQRKAVRLVIDHSFSDDALGLDADLVRHLAKEYWYDPRGMRERVQDPNYRVHDLAAAFHATGLTLLLQPTTLRLVYDNEYRAQRGADRLTVAELLRTVTEAVWDGSGGKATSYSAASPMCSSFRRNLQREHVDRLVDLTLTQKATSASQRAIRSLAALELEDVDARAERALGHHPDRYSEAHLRDVRRAIGRALDAAYVVGK